MKVKIATVLSCLFSVVLSAGAISVAASSADLSGEQRPSDLPPDFKVQKFPVLGPVLTNSGGMTLYVFACDNHVDDPKETAAKEAAAGLLLSAPCSRILEHFAKRAEPGKPQCVGTCAQAYPPMLAPATATPVGDLSVVVREDGTSQWAFKGQPLYLHIHDRRPGEVTGDQSSGPWQTAMLSPDRKMGMGRTAAASAPTISIPVVGGITGQMTREGAVLADSRGRTLYAAEGTGVAAGCDGTCAQKWDPLAAPALAGPIGDWTVVQRNDKTPQWAFKGKPLYVCTEDLKPGDTNCDGGAWQAVKM